MSKKIPNKTTKSRKAPVIGTFLGAEKSSSIYSAKKSLFLYRFVYSSSLSFAVVLLLILSFSLQNAERVYANSDLPSESTSAKPETNDIEHEVIDIQIEPEIALEPSAEESNQQEEPVTEVTDEIFEVQIEETLAKDFEQIETENLEATTLDSTASLGSESNQTEQVLEITDEENSALEDYSSSSETQEDSPVLEAEENNEVASDDSETGSQDDILSESTEDLEVIEAGESLVAEEIVEESLSTTYETISYTESDNEFSFNKDECTQLATGSFYCLQPQENKLDDALFSAPDSDGDLEIFLVREGTQAQITDNQMDDAAPYYDKNTNTIVWHRLIDDRYQIISYDTESKEETQLTKNSENNMEPTRQGNYTVWQRWINGGWNIILFDGKTETQITKNSSHNVAPYIHGSLVVWNSRNESSLKTIEMFDIETKTYVTVDDPDGMSVSNPRMVFVYDSLHPNGDIVTKGYDVMARKFIELDSLPRDLPDELPASDSTGETRALIQSKPSVKSEAEESINSSSTPNILPPVPLDSASSTNEMTLDLSQGTLNDAQSQDSNEFVPSEFDLVITPLETSLSSSTEGVQE